MGISEEKTSWQKTALVNQVLNNLGQVTNALNNTDLKAVLALKQNIETYKDKILEYSNQIKTLDGNIQGNKDTIEQAKNEITRLQELISADKTDITTKSDNFKSTYASVLQSIALMEAKEADVNNSLDIATRTLHDIQVYQPKLKLAIDEAKQYLTQYDEAKADISLNLREIEQKTDIFDEKYANAMHFKDDLESLKTQTAGYLHDCEKLIETARQLNDTSHAEYIELSKLGNELRSIVSSANDDFRTQKDNLKETIKIAYEHINSLKTGLQADVKSISDALKTEYNSLFDNLKYNTERMDVALFECYRLTTLLEQGVSFVEKTKATIGEQYNTIKKISLEVADANTTIAKLKKAVEDTTKLATDMQDYSKQIDDFKNEVALLDQQITAKRDDALKQIDDLKDALVQTAGNLEDTYKQGLDDALAKITDTLKELNDVKAYLATIQTTVDGMLKTSFNKINDDIKVAVQTLADQTSDSMQSIVTQGQNIEDNLNGLIDNFTKQIEATITGASGDLNNLKTQLNSEVTAGITQVQTAITSFETAKTSALSDLNTAKVDGVNALNTLKNEATTTYTNLSTELTTKANVATTAITTAKTGALTDIDTKKQEVITALQNMNLSADIPTQIAQLEDFKANQETLNTSVDEKITALENKAPSQEVLDKITANETAINETKEAVTNTNALVAKHEGELAQVNTSLNDIINQGAGSGMTFQDKLQLNTNTHALTALSTSYLTQSVELEKLSSQLYEDGILIKAGYTKRVTIRTNKNGGSYAVVANLAFYQDLEATKMYTTSNLDTKDNKHGTFTITTPDGKEIKGIITSDQGTFNTTTYAVTNCLRQPFGTNYTQHETLCTPDFTLTIDFDKPIEIKAFSNAPYCYSVHAQNSPITLTINDSTFEGSPVSNATKWTTTQTPNIK